MKNGLLCRSHPLLFYDASLCKNLHYSSVNGVVSPVMMPVKNG